jgi:cytochrome bd-type quinol oxidase subunit 2
MHYTMNIASKLILLGLLAVAGLAAWLLPKTRLAPRRQIGDKLFVATFVTGILCAAAGLTALFAWPQQTRDWHLWELTAMPLVLIYAYWLAVVRRARTTDVIDEKQDFDMTKCAALAWTLSIPAISSASTLFDAGLFDPALLFPYFLLVTLLGHSVGTLHHFKR